MQPEDMIVLDEFCASHSVEISFIRSLEEHGLIEIITVNQTQYLYHYELPKLERVVRLHQELHINPEGIDAVNNLLHRIENLQHEIMELRNKLNFYDENE
jgi:phage terminase small subunit